MKNIKEFFSKNKKEISANGLAMLAAVLIVTGVFIFWGNHKIMWFCDEIYSYFTANSGSGIGARIVYGEWYDGQFVVDDMRPEAGRFFQRTINNVKADDHPPVYFLTMHMASLLADGSISKWIGLSVNLICTIGICIFAYILFAMMTKNKMLAAMGAVALGVLPSVLTNGMLIRMYCMVTAWAMLYIFLSYFLMQENINKWIKLAGYCVIAIATAFGFLTQYYFAVLAVGFTLFYGIWCLIKKRWKPLGCYLASMVAAVGIATVIWDEWIDQLFNQYCGEEVFSKAADFSGIIHEIQFGLTVMPKLMFYNFWWLGVILVIAGLVFLIIKKEKHVPIISMLLGGSLFYSLIVAHVTPSYYLDNRYFYMSTTVAYVAVIMIFLCCVQYLPEMKYKKYVPYGVLAFLIVFNGCQALFNDMSMGYVDKSGAYHEKIAALDSYGDLPWVYYGYESWTMMENYYDFPMSDKFICYNDMNDFDSKKCPAEGEDFIFMVNSASYPEPEVILEKLNETVGCKHEVEFLFKKGANIFIVRHK